jgi:predicted RNA-binding protein YlxR (DUF448 family)
MRQKVMPRLKMRPGSKGHRTPSVQAALVAASPPLRRCIASGSTLPTDRLVRFIIDPQGTVIADILGKLPGRGLWVQASGAHIDQALEKNMFAKAARCRVDVDKNLRVQVEAGLARRCGEILGLANRAGQAVAGFEKVRTAVRTGRAAVLIAAADASPQGLQKMRSLAPGLVQVDCLSVTELSLAMGRENVVHAALAPGGLAPRFLIETARLDGVRGLQKPRLDAPSA